MCTLFNMFSYADTVAGLKPDIVTVQLNFEMDIVMLLQKNKVGENRMIQAK